MQIETDGLSARVDDLVEHLERPRDTTLLRVLETKAAAGEAAIGSLRQRCECVGVQPSQSS
jgi:hypothetical protein